MRLRVPNGISFENNCLTMVQNVELFLASHLRLTTRTVQLMHIYYCSKNSTPQKVPITILNWCLESVRGGCRARKYQMGKIKNLVELHTGTSLLRMLEKPGITTSSQYTLYGLMLIPVHKIHTLNFIF